MPIWIAVLLGAVQGFAEFLPISSSGHLALLQNILNFEQYGADHITFDIFLHLGTLVAVFIAFRQDIAKLIQAFFGLAFNKFKVDNKPSRRFVLMLLLASLPLAVGALIEGVIESAFKSTLFIGCALIFTAIMLYAADRISSGHKTEKDAKYSDALFVGVMQLLAVFPGISRSGATMCGGLFTGFSRDFAVRFAFIMSIPAVLGATVFKLPDMVREGLGAGNLLPYALGFLTSALCGYLAIWLVKTLMKRNSFKYFALYCAVVGVITVVLNLV